MKKLITSIIFVLISIINTFGQHYQTIGSNRIAYFDNEYGNIKCIRIDSVKHQQVDSVLFPFATIQKLDYECFSPFVASWIGKSITIKDNGLNEFNNKTGNTISIKTNANLGEKWIAFVLPDSLTIEATVLSHDTLTFIGITDSVKTIGFQSYDKNMNKINKGLNGMQLQISKNYGFVKTFNFYLFPDLQADYPIEKFEEYDLIGLSNPKVGVNNLTWFEVNDFQVGDELHILDESVCRNIEYGYAKTNKAIYRYLERNDYPDSIVYRYARKQSIYTNWFDSSSFLYYDDTLKTVIKSNSLFDKLPGEPIVIDNAAFNYYMTNESPLSKTYPGNNENFMFRGDSCWTMVIADGCLTADKYIMGLGGPYYSCTHTFCWGGEERKLVYYKKGDITWGSPLEISGIADISNAKDIKVYPNPSKKDIYITFPDSNYHNPCIYIYNIQGELQKVKQLESNNSLINISELRKGIYILKIADNETILKIDKLIIE
jgi:hypothetical protein